MGSQTLEILRQGIWASLTGGWFYDPHQNLFCNTVHLYIWLFLLCLPFSIYLYFPPASLGWIIYCSLVAAVFTCLKLINHGLHHMYDTSECIIVHQPAKGQNNESQREEGMEMQMLRLGVAALNTSDNESITSLEYHKPNASTIDLKVDVHRKNSSESSLDNAAAVVKSQDNATAITKSDLCVAQSLEATGSSEIRRTRPRSSHKRDHRTKTRKYCVSKGHELNLENNRLSKNDDSLVVNLDEGPFAKVSRHYSESHNISPNNKDFIKEWLYLDGKEAVADETYQAKYSRQLSIDSRDSSEQNVGPPSPKKRMSQRRRYNNYADESYSKSAMALVTSQSSNMRRNSNSTMSTIQLPLLNSTAQLVSQMRRHSNNADSDFFASVELGKYMMEKSEPPGAEKGKTSKDKTSGVRRIKSAALEIGCPPPSVSNLSPHPNSAETIGGQILKNPKSAVIPPPSKCLTRGPHLNLCPKNESGEGSSYPYLNYGSEIVYPIAEISDEMQTSQKETDIDSSEDSYSEYEEENINMKLQFRGFDWEADQSPEARSSDSDFENNGSRSPLLDRTSDVKVVKNRTVGDNSKKNICIRHSNIKQIEFNNDRSKVMPNIKLTKDHVKNLKTESNNLKNHAVQKQLSKNITKCENDTIDHFDKNSVISKDFLIKKHSVELNETSNLHKIDKKSWEQDQSSYGTSSIESNDNIVFKNKTENEKAELDDEKLEVRSVYSINWLFEDLQKNDIHEDLSVFDVPNSNTNFRKNLGAIPKQNRNVSRSRGSSQKENKIKENKKDKDQNSKEEIIDTVEAQAALVQGLECLFAATNASTVVMPNHNPEDRPRSSRQQSIRLEREPSTKARKRSIEEVAQSSTNALLPTSMPLLAAFLHSRVDFPHVQVSLPTYPQAPSEAYQNIEDNRRRSRPLMERNHRNRMRKLKRSSKQKMTQETSTKRPQGDNPNNNITHLATSFDDTSEGAVHCFRDEYGNWVSYTFDPNNPSKSEGHSVISKVESSTHSRKKSLETAESLDTAGDVSCGSLDSEVGNSDKITKSKRGESLDQSSSNQGSNNPLLANSYNNLSTVVPINTNASNKRLSVFDGGTSSLEPRSPVAFVTDSLLEQIEAERQSRMGLPSMHINFLLSQQRAQQQAHNSDNANNMQGAILMPSIGEENLEINLRSKFSKLMGDMEKSNQPKPKSYYKFRFFKNWEVKVSMDRLKLMALFDRNLTFSETFISIFLAIIVAILGSFVLNLGLYRDIYAFWFCFIIAGSQYSLLKSVQPDSASPVHGFNKMVVFSRPVYFCLCSAILCGANRYLEEFSDSDSRSKINASPINVYGMKVNEKEILTVIQNIVATFLLFFPLAFSLGFFPQVNTFLMYLLEQIDMHVFGGNATSSLSAAFYCVFRSMTAIGVLYGFAYSGLVEGKKSQHQKHNIIFSIFCGLLVPISYHLSRSASDYSMMWNLVKKHLLPPELYMSQSTEFQNEEPKEKVGNITEQKKENSESNVSKEHSIGSSASKINFSSETNIAKLKRSQTSSASSLKNDAKCGDSVNSSNFTKTDNEPNDNPPEVANESKLDENIDKIDDDMEDPLPRKLQATVNARLKNDVIVCTFLGLCAFGLHCTTIFTTLRPQLNTVLWMIAGILGWILHYFTPQLRKQQPWLFFAGPALRQHEYTQFEVSEPARLMVFEKIFVYLCFLERNILFPAVVIAATTQDAPTIADKYGDAFGALIICVCALKCLRNCYSDPNSQYLIIVFAFLLFQRDLSTRNISETFLVDYFVMAIIFNKVYEFLLKVQFVVTYIAPWQITWGSAFHAFAQPFSVPHSAMLFLQAAFSALLSSPLTPALGSAIFMTSYVRPVKFWERDYNTKRVDQSNTRLSSHLERNLGSDDNNLNSIFYEHLTRSLQHYLCGDLMLGRWGPVQQGDCFVLASDYLNCLVHIVEMGNGLVSFQLRGLEFRGTYCQQREVEAISEGPEENNDGVCGWWCNGRVLSPGAMFSLRWLAWQLTSSKYVLEGYSVSDNSAVSMLQVFDFRKVLLTYYVKSIIYYTLQSSKLEEWLSSSVLVEALKPVSEKNFADLDPIFNVNLDEDYDFRASGITRSRFCSVYQEWIVHCCQRRGGGWRRKGTSRDSPLVTLCFALSLVGRRALAAAQHLSASSVEFFLYGLHSLFKGDFRITCARDEWVFTDMSLLHSVLSPAIRMALKLHQDHFMFPEEYCSSAALYTAISSHTSRLVICHEAAPAWRYNVLRGAPHLLALRHVMDEGSDDYKIIMLNKRHLGFRVIKLNRECVRGLWAGQQQELIYLRNRNPERGSIQNAKQALRNIINSSCDQPIGYPIYVSPLTTSYADTSEQLCSLVGGAVSVKAIKSKAIALWRRVRRRCGEGCSSGSGTCDVATVEAGTNRNNASTPRHNTLHLSRNSLAGTRGSLASAGKPTSSTLASLAGLLREHSHERAPDVEAANGSTQDGTESRRSEERLSGSSGTKRERNVRVKNKDAMRQLTAQTALSSVHGGGSRSRMRREHTRHASFRLLGAERLNTDNPDNKQDDDRQLPDPLWDGREQPRRAVSVKVSSNHHASPQNSSSEDLSLSPSGPDACVNERVVPKRSMSVRQEREFKRYYSNEGTSKDLSKPSKEIRHERESYRELTGRYTEKPDVSPINEAGAQAETSKGKSRDSKKDSKQREIKTKIKRIDSGQNVTSVSVGSKVLIVEPLGVYDCINLGRRIDVLWPSEFERERGGRNHWGSWVPMAGMDGLVVHKWTPNHRDPKLRSHVDKNILLVQINERFVPIAENCVQDLGDEV